MATKKNKPKPSKRLARAAKAAKAPKPKPKLSKPKTAKKKTKKEAKKTPRVASKVKHVKVEKVGHARLKHILAESFGGNLSSCARALGIVMPAVHRWVNSNSVPSYESREILFKRFGIAYEFWYEDFSSTSESQSSYVRSPFKAA